MTLPNNGIYAESRALNTVTHSRRRPDIFFTFTGYMSIIFLVVYQLQAYDYWNPCPIMAKMPSMPGYKQLEKMAGNHPVDTMEIVTASDAIQ